MYGLGFADNDLTYIVTIRFIIIKDEKCIFVTQSLDIFFY